MDSFLIIQETDQDEFVKQLEKDSCNGFFPLSCGINYLDDEGKDHAIYWAIMKYGRDSNA